MAMDPMQQPSAPQNPYGFIMNPDQQPKRPLFGGSSKTRLIIVVAGVFLLIVIAFIVMSIFSSMSSSGTEQLKLVYAEQQEVIRIAEMGAKDARSSDTRNFATTTLFATQTSQQQIGKTITSQGVKLKPEDISAKKNSKVESILTGAAANNRYDETIRELLEKQIASYSQALQTAYNENTGQQTQAALSDAFKSTSVLIAKPTEAN